MELDSLEIKVQSSSQEAASGLDKLAASLKKRVEKGKMAQEDKDALMNNVLIPETHEESADADLVIECRKTYADWMKPDCFLRAENISSWYPNRDFHKIFFGEVAALSATEQYFL